MCDFVVVFKAAGPCLPTSDEASFLVGHSTDEATGMYYDATPPNTCRLGISQYSEISYSIEIVSCVCAINQRHLLPSKQDFTQLGACHIFRMFKPERYVPSAVSKVVLPEICVTEKVLSMQSSISS